ncbi:hypothetical protein PoB_004764000 [Plakobranchus ocellatus]|uniref:Uncharacterized protein n=1 Tax=Plakobranchus ocellatus TaxID=259542 RepID=A0AAV4BPV0_9GAST|nr:hypothetical protein PoB_004764000 [Plakobranchus ocellatus]
MKGSGRQRPTYLIYRENEGRRSMRDFLRKADSKEGWRLMMMDKQKDWRLMTADIRKDWRLIRDHRWKDRRFMRMNRQRDEAS